MSPVRGLIFIAPDEVRGCDKCATNRATETLHRAKNYLARIDKRHQASITCLWVHTGPVMLHVRECGPENVKIDAGFLWPVHILRFPVPGLCPGLQ